MSLVYPNPIPTNYQSNMLDLNNATARIGKLVAAGTTVHVKGNFIEIVNTTSKPSNGLHIFCKQVASSAGVRNYLLDIALGTTGSEVVVIPNLHGSSSDTGTSGKSWYFPYYIPEGTRISARAQASTSADTSFVGVMLYQGNNYYNNAPGEICDYGTDLTTSTGLTLSTFDSNGGTNSMGPWKAVTSGLTRSHRFWVCTVGNASDTNLNNEADLTEIGVGITSGSVTTLAKFHNHESTLETVESSFPQLLYAPNVAGTTLWTRILAAASDNVRSIIIHGM